MSAMTIPSRLALSASLVVMCACGAARSPSASTDGTTWREFKSQHFALRTDADTDDAHASLADCETMYGALRAILFSDDRGATKPVQVYLFAHASDLRRYIPAGADAVFISDVPGDPESGPTMLLETSFNDVSRRMFLHEMTHAFVWRSFSRVPLWLNEGLAEYFQTLRIESGRVVLGEPISSFGISANQMPALNALLAADPAVFYAGRAEHSVEGLYQQTAYYTAAWYLVHMFMHDKGDYRGRFHDFLDALKRRVPYASAWARSFDDATMPRLARDYLEYLRSDSLDAGFVAIEVQTIDKVGSTDRVIPQEQLQGYWARLHQVTRR
jgi:hypothetical protein